MGFLCQKEIRLGRLEAYHRKPIRLINVSYEFIRTATYNDVMYKQQMIRVPLFYLYPK
jgi:hypothetical protein